MILAKRTAMLSLLCALSAPLVQSQDCSHLRVNQIQVVGVHNTYHAGLALSETKLLTQTDPALMHQIDYRHRTLREELDAGVRQVELDVLLDRKGSEFRDPLLVHKVAEAGLPADPPLDPKHLLDTPGYKVLHVRDVDYRSTCEPYTGCLREIAAWSKEHPHHLPIFIFTENKETEKLAAADLDRLDAEVRSVFQPSQLLTPDDVRGRFGSLRASIEARGWPLLEASRGKVILLLAKVELEGRYTAGHPQLEGRVFFPNATLGRPYAGFTVLPDPAKDAIVSAVRQGYLVLTRTDTFDQDDAARNDLTRQTAAFASGAQLMLTDYPPGEPEKRSGYVTLFPGGLRARANPVLVSGCTNDLLSLEGR